MFRRTALVAAAAFTALALTACGSENLPAPPSATESQVPAPPSSTSSAPTPGDTEAPQVSEPPSPEPVAPIDPAIFVVPGDQIAWRSPSSNIYCKIGSGPFSSGCQAPDAPVPDGSGDDCTPNTTFTIDRLSKGFYLDAGKVTPTCFNQGVFGSISSKVLEYNTSVTYNGYTCTSRVEGMMCDAGDGHGFVLSKQQATWN